MVRKYKVADNIFEVADESGSRAWSALEWHYRPFEVSEGESLFTVRLRDGRIRTYYGYEEVYDEIARAKGDVGLRVYRNAHGDYLFALSHYDEGEPSAWLAINASMTDAVATFDESGQPKAWMVENTVTSLMQLVYHLATNSQSTLVTHTSAVVKDGVAYLFQGKSGTGKSTHARMWLENIPGSEAMNDDHPVIRIGDDGTVTAYGSPWSGKTDCYKNMSAPVGGLVRITRAPHNAIKHLPPLEAYASITSTIFKLPFDRTMADLRHKNIERVVMSVPCYELECLPDADAALCCYNGVTR